MSKSGSKRLIRKLCLLAMGGTCARSVRRLPIWKRRRLHFDEPWMTPALPGTHGVQSRWCWERPSRQLTANSPGGYDVESKVVICRITYPNGEIYIGQDRKAQVARNCSRSVNAASSRPRSFPSRTSSQLDP